MKPTALKRDQQQVKALVDRLNQTCLIHISTSMLATKDVYGSLLTTDDGGTMCETFVISAFSVDQSERFYNPIPKSKLKTFEHMTSKTGLKCKSVWRNDLRSHQFRTCFPTCLGISKL